MERDLCANCDRWREEHYDRNGLWIADRWQVPCISYSGIEPSEERRKQKADELASVRAGRAPIYDIR